MSATTPSVTRRCSRSISAGDGCVSDYFTVCRAASGRPGARRRLGWLGEEGGMYVPAHFAPDQTQVDELLRNHGAADLVTVTERGLVATMLPFVYVPPSDPAAAGPRSAGQHRSPEQHRSAGQHGALHGHLARNNDQWKLS